MRRPPAFQLRNLLETAGSFQVLPAGSVLPSLTRHIWGWRQAVTSLRPSESILVKDPLACFNEIGPCCQSNLRHPMRRSTRLAITIAAAEQADTPFAVPL